MECHVCGGKTEVFCKKDFRGHLGLHRVEYARCQACGFAVSSTHMEMAPEEWESLSYRYHASYLGTPHNPDDPNWVERIESQAEAIAALAEAGLIRTGLPWIDHGCGDGKLADLLDQRGLSTLKYEPYTREGRDGYIRDGELREAAFDNVISCSVFQSIRGVEVPGRVAALVADSGVLSLHVLVCETIPSDPSWFFYLPATCTFLTNRSMELLFERWGFSCSIYDVEARMWFCFKRDPEEVESLFVSKRRLIGRDLHYKKGFVDYWKGEPYRSGS
jgi:hypothetical protein